MSGVSTHRGLKFRTDSPLAYVLYFAVYVSVLLRVVLRTPREGLVPPLVYGLLAVFLGFSVLQAPISRRWAPWAHVHLGILSLIICVLLLTEPRLDYYAILFVGLSFVAASALPQGADLIWIGVMCVVLTLALLAAFGLREAASYGAIYVAGSLIMGMAVRESRKAEEARALAEAARERSDELLVRLTEAHRRLRAYAEQAEEAAAAQERARLARDLHDAATQTVFSMNLTAEAARMALDQDPGRVPAILERLQELARDALAEMRWLVEQLRPQSIEELGLVKTLERHIAARERRDGLKVTLEVAGEERGAPAVKEVLFRSAQEALSNVLKHAAVTTASIMLRFNDDEAILRVSDAGRGFDPKAARGPESFGLTALGERVAALHGSVDVRSQSGKGTEIEVRLPLAGGSE